MTAALVDGAVLAFAGWTLLCHAAVLLDASLYAVMGGAVLLSLMGARRLRRPEPAGTGEGPLWALAALAAACVLLSHRPDSDDALYLGFASGVADFPGSPLLKADTLYGLPGLPVLLATYRLHAYEPLVGALSLLTGLSVPVAAHLVLAPLWGGLVPLAFARLFGALGVERRALAAAAATAFLLMDGGAHGSWGNMAFVRLFQGKGVLATMMLPLAAAYALEFARAPSRRSWLHLAAALVASAGFTSSGLWSAPLAAGLAFASAWRPKDGWKPAAAALLAAAYPLGVASVLRSAVTAGALGALRLAEGREWDLLTGTLDYVAQPGAHRWALAALTLLAPALGGRWAWAALGGFLFLYNPWTGPWAAMNLTSPPNYYRVFWLLPMPAFVGLAAAGAPRRAAVALAVAAAVVLPRSTLSAANGTRLGFPGLKVPSEYPLVRAVAEAVPGRALVLAPTEVSQWLVVERGHDYPLLVKDIWFDELHRFLKPEDIARRRALMGHVGGQFPKYLSSAEFRAGLAAYAPTGVVLDLRLPWTAQTRRELGDAGYAPAFERDGYALYLR